MFLYETSEWKSATKRFHSINDRPVCLFINYDEKIPLSERIQILSIEDGQSKENQNIGHIVLMCFNTAIKVKKVDYCDTCGCYPCDCNWGIQ